MNGRTIVIPRIDDKHDLPSRHKTRKKGITWLPVHEVGTSLVIGTCYSQHGDSSPTEVTTESISILGHLDLRSGERFWIFHFLEQMTSEEKQRMIDLREPLEVNVKPTADISKMGGSLVIFFEPAGGSPAMVELILGAHLFKESSALS